MIPTHYERMPYSGPTPLWSYNAMGAGLVIGFEVYVGGDGDVLDDYRPIVAAPDGSISACWEEKPGVHFSLEDAQRAFES